MRSFVGVGSYNLGREYGRQVLKLVSVGEYHAHDGIAVLVNAPCAELNFIVCSEFRTHWNREKIRGPEIELS